MQGFRASSRASLNFHLYGMKFLNFQPCHSSHKIEGKKKINREGKRMQGILMSSTSLSLSFIYGVYIQDC
jgi:hypothetical protein